MATERVQKPIWQPSSQKKQSPIVPPLIDSQTEADSLPSPKVPVSGVKSKAERDAIRRSLFEKWASAAPQQMSESKVVGHSGSYTATETIQGQKASQMGIEIQAKLTIGKPGDKYEQEADQVAAQIVNQINAPAPPQAVQSQSVQREAIRPQAASKVSQPNESAEQEADAVARQVIGGESVQVSKSAVLGVYRSPLYRGMTDDGGKPQIGDSARNLGVRQQEITVEQRDGKDFIIAKDTEGMSTAPGTPRNLPQHRRNKDWGGTGKDPVWEIDDSKVTGALKAFQDKPTHVTVAASHDMPLEDFKAALSSTQNNWKKALPPS